VVELVLDEEEDGLKVVVVSALGGVTDQLITAVQEAVARSGKHTDILAEIEQRHYVALESLAPESEREALREEIETRLSDLGELLDGVYLLRECTHRTRDAIIGMGEQLSAPLAAAAFRAAGADAVALDARDFIRTDSSFGEANVLFEPTTELIRKR